MSLSSGKHNGRLEEIRAWAEAHTSWPGQPPGAVIALELLSALAAAEAQMERLTEEREAGQDVRIERVSYNTQILLDVVAYEANIQKDAAAAYAFGLQRGDVNWPIVNAAIVERWSKSGLRRIKDMAWKGTYA